jgi:D-sedoheptulose 7-phosphate isomerase
MNNKARISEHFEQAAQLLEQLLSDANFMDSVETGGNALASSIARGGKIISCGNGGSMSDAMHFAEELSGRYREHRPGIAAISCSYPSHITCVGNDYGFEFIFSRFVEAVGQKEDALLAISTSGNSANVIEAAKAAKTKGMTVIGLTGRGGGELKDLCDVVIDVPWKGFADRVQEVHIKVIHAWIDLIERQQ